MGEKRRGDEEAGGTEGGETLQDANGNTLDARPHLASVVMVHK